ncbi:hypothetical protein [Streptacidiphilus sp. PAMC 29251]
MPSEDERPRTSARHAAPRMTVRGRMQLPVGRALAMTAVPTALIMGSLAPRFAFAADTAKAVPISSTSTTQPAKGSNGTDCSTTATTPATKTPATKAPVTKAPTTQGPLAKKGTTAKGTTGQAAGQHSTTPTATPTPSATATPSHQTRPEPLKTLLDGLGSLLVPKAPQTPQAPQPSQTQQPQQSTVTPRTDATGSPTTPTATPTATPTTTPTGTPTKPTSKPTTPKPASTASTAAKAQANRMCDVSKLAAPLDKSAPTSGMPNVPWTLKTSRLALGSTQFWGVKTVDTAGGPVRVLKFTAQTVQIDNLDMSANQNGQLLHVQGGPSTTSTISGGTVTMYVTSLSGTLSKAEGIPLAALGIKLTLTPDSLPEWILDLVGDVPIPLNLELTDATAIQTGQFGGNLTIPGMHLYYTPLTS